MEKLPAKSAEIEAAQRIHPIGIRRLLLNYLGC
jgi:hypothetical protein